MCVFADSIRNYISKFVNDDWLLERGLIGQSDYDLKYIKEPDVCLFGGELKICELNLKEVKAISKDFEVKNVLKEFQNQRVDFVKKAFFLPFFLFF